MGFQCLNVINGQYSRDLIQGGLELPCTYTYSTTDEGLYGQLVELVSDFMESYRIRIQKLDARNTKKKKKNTEKSSKIQYNI